jgi:enamine deaminase RidA (YjgF/YER057c/UK114 family)
LPHYSNPTLLSPPYGLYSQMSHSDGPLHFVAGQLAVDEDGSVIGSGDLAAQLREVLRRIELAAASVDLGLSDVVQFTTYLAGRELIHEFYAAREELFKEIYPDGSYPPNTLIAVAGLVEPDLLVEVQAILSG